MTTRRLRSEVEPCPLHSCSVGDTPGPVINVPSAR